MLLPENSHGVTREILNNRGFTLAEVLITLSIIGVIAALTIIPLAKNYQNKMNRIAFKKNYAAISQTVLQIKNEQGSLLGFQNSGEIHNALKKYLSYTKECWIVAEIPGKCWHNNGTVKFLDGSSPPTERPNRGLVLKNGVFFGPGSNVNPECEAYCAILWIDVNGFKGPNTIGRDIFLMYIDKDAGLQPSGIEGKPYPDDCGTNSRGWGCARWVLEGLDY